MEDKLHLKLAWRRASTPAEVKIVQEFIELQNYYYQDLKQNESHQGPHHDMFGKLVLEKRTPEEQKIVAAENEVLKKRFSTRGLVMVTDEDELRKILDLDELYAAYERHESSLYERRKEKWVAGTDCDTREPSYETTEPEEILQSCVFEGDYFGNEPFGTHDTFVTKRNGKIYLASCREHFEHEGLECPWSEEDDLTGPAGLT